MKVNEGGAAVAEEEEKIDGADNEAVEENKNDGLEQGGATHPDGREDGGEAGKDGGEDAGEDGVEEVKEEPVDPRDEMIADLTARLEAIEKGSKPEEKEAPAKVYTEVEKAEIEQRFGGAPFEQVQAFTSTIARAIGMLRQEFQNQFSRTDKTTVIGELSKEKGFADIHSYAPGIDEFLKKLNPSLHGNKDMLKDAYYWAKGRGLKKAVAKAVNANEKNRRISGPARPAAPSGKAPAKGALKFKLTPTEESAYQTYQSSFKSKEDYARSLARYKNAA